MLKNYNIYAEKEYHLMMAVGLVMDRWARLEFQILNLTAWALQMPLAETAKLTSAFRSFALILDFAASACSMRLGASKYLKSIMDLSRELSGDRNFIAHTQVGIHHPVAQLGKEKTEDYAKATPLIGPAVRPYLTGDTPKRDPMDVTEVREIASDIQHLVEAIMTLVEALQSGAPLPEKFHGPIKPRRPRLAQRRAQSGKVPKPQEMKKPAI